MGNIRSTGVALGALGLGFTLSFLAPDRPSAQVPPVNQLVVQSALLNGLSSGAVFPFIDTTPRRIARAHIAIADDTASCAPGAAAPLSMQVLVGEAGVALVNVMTAATNTGISTTPGQCVFHVTVVPGAGGVPGRVTDIVVLNAGGVPLTGINTVTVSAQVR